MFGRGHECEYYYDCMTHEICDVCVGVQVMYDRRSGTITYGMEPGDPEAYLDDDSEESLPF